MTNTIHKILQKHKLRNTPARSKVLAAFLSFDFALSHAFLEQHIEEVDRVTLYRTLKKFETLGVIHHAIDGSNNLKYALCHADCEEEGHHDNHIHFHCKKCEKTNCIEDLVIPKFTLPKGYKIEDVQFTVNGICQSCTSSN